MEPNLEKQSVHTFDPECVRKKSNWSRGDNKFKFDDETFDPNLLLENIPDYSPKLSALISKIEDLDRKDQEKHGKLFKHFIFSDLKSGTYGAKMLASAFIAKGFHLGYGASLKLPRQKGGAEEEAVDNDGEEGDDEGPSKKSRKRYNKIELLSDSTLATTTNENFYMMCSVSVYDQPISVVMKKSMLSKFNQRPENIQGELVRFIILDSGFKEGIDLFDIKYIHIFEPSVVASDQKQVIGRGTRTCGQKGLEFHPTQGWPLHIFIYDLTIQESIRKSLLGAETAMDLYLKAMNLDVRLLTFASDLEKNTIFGSVDYELNENVHNFAVASRDEDDSSDIIVGGGPNSSGDLRSPRELSLRNVGGVNAPSEPPSVVQGCVLRTLTRPKLRISSKPPRIVNTQEIVGMNGRLGFKGMRRFIRDRYGEFAWDPVKMENLCAEKTGGSSVLNYTPTQDFIRHYFTPTQSVKGMLLYHSVGTGKCHAKNTPILMHDGTIKMVQDVNVGDVLMGDDSTPRKVLSLANGQDEMYDIIPVKGEKYTVNSEHILCLKYSGRGAIINVSKRQPNKPFKTTMIDNKTYKIVSNSFKTREEAENYLNKFNEEDRILEIEVKDYFKLSESLRRDLKGYRKGVDFEEKPLSFDPYIIGLWIGDGSKRGSGEFKAAPLRGADLNSISDARISFADSESNVFSSQDAKILKYLRDTAGKYGLMLNYQSQYDYRLSKNGTCKTNLLMDELHKYNLINNKHIPYDYKCNSRENRLKLLAGILDTDGYYCSRGKMFSISQKSDQITTDILFLARSLGFAAYNKKSEKSCMYKGEKKTGLYNSITISGNNLDEIPTLLTRKRAEKRTQIKDVLLTGVTICPVGKGDYYGFCIDKNRRYLMGDFTVTHNTCSAIAAATTNFEKAGYTILWVTRTTLKNDIWKNMFDQVCNESIRYQMQHTDLKIPTDQSKRMRLLSKAWRIRPMSYKQFSNLVSKQNSFYETLVKINGKEDPLRKTLLIIDEAHKLYGGGDLSSLEKPDMNALHQALMYSYKYSGQDSVRLLLMTATPVTQNPMELIQLVNLCKQEEEQMPADFSNFSDKYLDDHGTFTEKGRADYLDDISGYISYLNREKDARQFSQPRLHYVNVPITSDMDRVHKFDRKIVRNILDSDILELKNQLVEENKKIQGEIAEINAKKFSFMKEEICGELEGPSQKMCDKIVNKNIRELVQAAKDELKDIRDKIKQVRDDIKIKGASKRDTLMGIKGNMENLDAEYNEYKKTLLYQIKNKCAMKITDKNQFDAHPVIQQYNLQIQQHNNELQDLDSQLKNLSENYKKRMKHLRTLLKHDLNEVERNVINMIIRDERKTYRVTMKMRKKETVQSKKLITTNISNVEKDRNKRTAKIRKTYKKAMSEDAKQKKQIANEEKRLRKTLSYANAAGIQSDSVKGLVNKYHSKIMDELVGASEEATQNAKNKEDQKAEKIRLHELAKRAKMLERERVRDVKKQEQVRIRETKKREKEEIMLAKKAEKQAARKTKKNKKEVLVSVI